MGCELVSIGGPQSYLLLFWKRDRLFCTGLRGFYLEKPRCDGIGRGAGSWTDKQNLTKIPPSCSSTI